MVAAVLALAACQQPQPEDNVPNEVEAAQPTLPSVPRPQPPLDRAGLFAAVAQAASSAASGADDSAAQRLLDGRQFEFRIRFGCRGPAPDLRAAWLGWAHDAESGTLRVRAKPTLGGDDALVKAIGGEFEAVEGFWIPRPWLLQPACPATAAVQPPSGDDAAAAVAESEVLPDRARVGIAQFFTATDARTGRRDMRAYEAVKTLEPGAPIGSQGFDLVLSGRLRALPGNQVIACVAAGADRPPDCIISAEFDQVWIERPDRSEVIAEWGGG